MNILLIGSGGREHAIAAKIAASKKCSQLYIAPGNAGTTECGTNVNLKVDDFEGIGKFVVDNDVKMVVVGPEAPLVAGIADFFASKEQLRNIMVIGPRADGARLEGSKDFAKQFMQRHRIPTAAYKTFNKSTLKEGQKFLTTLKPPFVLKADGLAAGKGVLIIEKLKEAQKELKAMLEEEKFGAASSNVVIEEYLSGIELSVFVLTDGKHYKILPSAKDYKRIGEGDTGLNTGGMGSVSPVPFADKAFMQKVEQRIVAPTVKGLQKENINYKGFIFVGLMAVTGADGSLDPYVIEYNVRMGDPETESVFPRIKSDVVELFEAVWNGNLNTATLSIDERTAACVMLTAEGYPESYRKGDAINGLEKVKEGIIFHAGTKMNDKGKILTNGGRVLCVTSMADNLPAALLKSLQMAETIKWKGRYYRHDIGQDLLKRIIEN
ncbi:MAG: phosphoribosylamine--glycine ligase [Bacteroidales bacterium]|nr:phosphoribosylamine--glycine ligase [Bacteroidales bacterium]